MSDSNNTSSQYHHSIGSISLSPLSLILICSVIAFLAGCGVWYFFLRVAFNKRGSTAGRRLMRQKLMLLAQEEEEEEEEEKSEKNTVIPYVASPGQDEEKHIEIVTQSAVHKRYYYGDIPLLDPFGKSHRMQTQQTRRRSSSARQHQVISQNDDNGEVDDSMIATQLAESPCARLFSSSRAQEDLNLKLANVPTNDVRPNRMWGPRVNVKSRTGLPPRSVSRTISFWKRTSVMAMKYADGGARYGNGNGNGGGEAGSRTFAGGYVPRVHAGTPPVVHVQGQGQPRRPLPQLPPLAPFPVTSPSINNPTHRNAGVPVQYTAGASITTISGPPAPCRRTAAILPQDRRFSTPEDSHQPRHTSLSSSILYSPESVFLEKTEFSTDVGPLDLGMHELRAAVDCSSRSTTPIPAITSASSTPGSEESKCRNTTGCVPVPVYSTVIHTKDIGLGTGLRDPYLRVQKILERAYSRT